MATAILGGARNFGLVPAAAHEALAWATVAANALALPWHYALLRRNGAIVVALERELEGVVADMEKRGELPPEGRLMPWQK